MKELIFVIITILLLSFTTTSEAADVQSTCVNYGKSAFMIGAFKIEGDSMQRQLDILTKLNISDTPTGRILANIIRFAYSPQAEINTRDDVVRFAFSIRDSCLDNIQTPTPQIIPKPSLQQYF